MVLDDALSAVDMKTAQYVLEACFGRNGVCRQIGTTVMMATHTGQYRPGYLREPYLSLSPDQHSHVADQIVMLSSNGRIEKQGSVRSLGLISQPITHATEASSETPTAGDESEDKSASTKKVETLTVDDIADVARRTGDVAVYTYYMRAIGWPSILAACLIIVVHTFSSTFPRKYIPIMHYTLLIGVQEVWLELFTSDDGQQAAQFIGIYVLLAVAASGSQGLMIW